MLKRSFTAGLVRDINGLTGRIFKGRIWYSPDLFSYLNYFLKFAYDWVGVLYCETYTGDVVLYYFLKMQITGIDWPMMPKVLRCSKNELIEFPNV